MKPPKAQDPLDRLAALARSAEPPALDPATAARMVTRARLGVPSRPEPVPSRPARFAWPLAFAACALAVAMLSGLGRWRASERPVPDDPPRLVLATGDAVYTAPGTHYALTAATAQERRVVLRRGAALFDVQGLGPGQRFEVETPQLRVRVRGTVFSVAVFEGRSEVRVYEGRVEVSQPGHTAMVGAGQRWSSGEVRVSPRDRGPLEDQGLAAARARAHPRVQTLAQTSPPPPTRVAPPQEPAPTPPAPAPSRVAHAPAAVPTRPVPAAAVQAPAPSVDPDTVRRWLAQGRFDDALSAARAHGASEGPVDAWDLVEADALRGLGRFREAATAYARCAAGLGGNTARQAAYAGAFEAPGSALAERALALRVRALHDAGRRDEARSAAARYLALHPDGGLATWARTLVGAP